MRLPRDLCVQAAQLLQDRYRDHVSMHERLDVFAEISDEAAEARLLLSDLDGDRRVEIGVRVPAKDPEDASRMDLALDAAEALLGEWLEGGREDRHPIDFVACEFRGEEVLVRMRKSRPSLEAAADRLLKEAGEIPEEEL